MLDFYSVGGQRKANSRFDGRPSNKVKLSSSAQVTQVSGHTTIVLIN